MITGRGKALGLVRGRGLWQVHTQSCRRRKVKAGGRRREGAPGGENLHICLEAIEGITVFGELEVLQYGSSLSGEQGGEVVTDATGQGTMKERPYEQEEGS